MTDQEAYEWLVVHRGVIAGNLRLQAMDAQGPRELADRVKTGTDAPEVRKIIEQAARWVIELEVEMRRRV